MKATPQNVRIICRGLDHPEGVAIASNGDLYAGGEAGQIYRIEKASENCVCIAETGGFILGVTLDGLGRVYACDIGRREIVQCQKDGEVRTYAVGTQERPLVNPNFSVFDGEGRLFFTDSGDYWNPSGSIWVIEPGARALPLTPPDLPFPNGLCLDSEKGYLYAVFSTRPKVVRFRLDGSRLGAQREVVAKLPDGVVPDGIALDGERNLWAGFYVPDEIWRITPRGKVDKVMQDSTGELLNRPTNIALDQGRVVFANLGGWHIGCFDGRVEPLPLHHPVL